MDSLLPISDPIVLDKVLDILYDDSLIKASSISKYRDSPGCNVQSRLYGYSTDYKRYCHGVNMRLSRIIKSVRCKSSGCNRTAHYCVNGVRMYCRRHKPIDTDYVVYHSTCDSKSCIRYPLYKDKKGGLKYCSIHKTVDCTVIYSNRCCKEEGCTKGKRYGYNGSNPEYCAEHGRL